MNAKNELLEIIKKHNVTIKCARLYFDGSYTSNYKSENINLKIRYTEEDYNIFLDKIDIEYDEGFGSQELFGIVWFTDGTWLDRGEYNGSEWWNYNIVPPVSDELL
jgi:hypothetical protein